MKAIFAALFASVVLNACAHASPPTDRLLHYVRSNNDGSLPEHIWVYQTAPDRVEVVKIVERCQRAAYVTAEFDVAANQPRMLVGGRLARDGAQEPFAWLSYDAHTRTLAARIPDAQLNADVTIQHEPWRIYDFDLADLTGLNTSHAPSRTDFSFNAVLIWPEEGNASPFRDLGLVRAEFVRAETHAGADALRYGVSGGLNGDLWLDAQDGHVVEARFQEPNHLEYRDFRLVLQSVTRDAADEWREVRRAHWADCPENE